jgi:hypothetical protein
MYRVVSLQTDTRTLTNTIISRTFCDTPERSPSIFIVLADADPRSSQKKPRRRQVGTLTPSQEIDVFMGAFSHFDVGDAKIIVK